MSRDRNVPWPNRPDRKVAYPPNEQKVQLRINIASKTLPWFQQRVYLIPEDGSVARFSGLVETRFRGARFKFLLYVQHNFFWEQNLGTHENCWRTLPQNFPSAWLRACMKQHHVASTFGKKDTACEVTLRTLCVQVRSPLNARNGFKGNLGQPRLISRNAIRLRFLAHKEFAWNETLVDQLFRTSPSDRDYSRTVFVEI